MDIDQIDKKFLLKHGNAKDILKDFPEKIFQTVVTSPPYWSLRDYFAEGQLGQEETFEEYVEDLVSILEEVKRVLRDDGTLWLNIGDSYNSNSGWCRSKGDWKRKGRENGSADKKEVKNSVVKRKELFGIPWRVAFALQEAGWYLRSDIIYSKTNPMPDGAKDRPTHSHEYIFLLTKKPNYYYDYYAILEDSKNIPDKLMSFGAKNQKGTFRCDQKRVFEHYGKKNKRSVWKNPVSSFKGDHFATFPIELINPCILAGTSSKGCCAECGTPIERQIKKVKVESEKGKGYDLRLVSDRWDKKCKCKTNETRPCLVLDPFSGMATTGIASLMNFRDYVGIDINSDYIDKSRKRINKQSDGITEVYDINDFFT